MMAELPYDRNIAILQAAHEVLRLLGRGWGARQAKDCEMCSYSPDVVRQYLHAFEELTASVEGIATSGVNPVTGRKHDRLTLLVIHSDLESATDKALINGRYILWQETSRVYRRQHRESFLAARRRELRHWQDAGNHVTPAREPDRPIAEAICIERISRSLGWLPHECEDAA